jgi:hypothetical protein
VNIDQLPVEQLKRSSRGRSRGRQSVLRRVVIAVLAAVCLVSAGTAWVGIRAVNARDHLLHAANLVRQLRAQLEDVDPAAVQTLAELQQSTRAARAETQDPGWRLGGRLPLAGDNLAAVRMVAATLDELARDGLPPLVETAGLIGTGALAPKDGKINLEPVRNAAPHLAVAHAAVTRAADRIATIPLDGLVAPLRTALADLLAELEGAADTTGVAARSTALLPPMLGVNGPRTYLLLFQNPAELRATGGMPGAYVVIRADRGKIEITDQGTAARDLGTFDEPVLELAESDRLLYGNRLGTYPANVNLTPDFPTAGALAREMYRRRTGHLVDGVLATDPIALSYLLGTLGAVPVPGGTDLTAANAVSVLLSKSYARDISSEKQDRYFGAAAKAVFQALVQRPLDPQKLLGVLARAAGERRLLVWSAHPADNELLAGTVLAGVLPASDGAQPTVGVFLNDGSGAKLGYYLTQSADLAVEAGCRADGRRRLKLKVVLGSTAPKSGLSEYVLGLGLAGDPYTVRTVVAVYGSTGGAMDSVTLDGKAVSFGSGRDRRRAVGIVAVDLKPGTERTLEVDLLTGVPRTGGDTTVTPRLWTTPGVRPWEQSVRSADGCPNTR